MRLLTDFLRSGYTRVRAYVAQGTPPKSSADAAPAAAHNAGQAQFEQAQALHQRGQLNEAEVIYRALLQKHPKDFDLLHLLGMIHGQRNDFAAAVALIEQAIAIDPGNAAGHSSHGNCLKGLNRHEEALASYDRALALLPNDADVLSNRGATLRDLKRPEEALESYDRALAIDPNHAMAHDNRGTTLRELQRPLEALTSHDRALTINPDYALAHYNRGIALRDLKRYEEARASYERALLLNPQHPEALNSLGAVLADLGQHEAALRSFEQALIVDPSHVETLNNQGILLTDLKRQADALASYKRALKIKPEDASIHWNLSLCQLQLGNFACGWKGYEWRWGDAQNRKAKRAFTQPLWLGAESLADKTILLHSEQGIGDTLQFYRYARRVSALGARVLIEVQPSLVSLLATLNSAQQVFAQGEGPPAFDYHCPLLSLPLAFKTGIGTIPADIPYVRSDPAQIAAWRHRLSTKTKPRIGLVWSGSAAHKNDLNRSLVLDELLPLISERAEWVSLQKEVRDSDAEILSSRKEIRHFGKQLKDFSDTAALVDLMDLVVTVDTSVAHLAGAMGKPVWILLPFNPDWRWLLDRIDSPWYPTARLLRQPARGDWRSVIDRVGNELSQQAF